MNEQRTARKDKIKQTNKLGKEDWKKASKQPLKQKRRRRRRKARRTKQNKKLKQKPTGMHRHVWINKDCITLPCAMYDNTVVSQNTPANNDLP